MEPAFRWPRAAYEQALRSALRSVSQLAVEPAALSSGHHRLDQLLILPAAERIAALGRHPPTLSLFEALRTRLAAPGLASEPAIELARLAEQVTARLDSAIYGAAFVLDRRCEATLALARALRAGGQLEACDRALTGAEAFAAQGTGALLAGCLTERARLTSEAGDTPRAVELWRAAARLHAEAQEPQEQALVLGELAGVLWRLRQRRHALLHLLSAISALGRAGRLRLLPQLLTRAEEQRGSRSPRSTPPEEGA